jgi:hypothetical protein
LVVLDDDTPPEMLTLAAGCGSGISYRRAADVIPSRDRVFQRKRRIVGTLAYDAAKEGIVYERS